MNNFKDDVTVIFVGNNKPFSLAIKLFTFSHFSHCAVLDEKGYVIDTTLATGVRKIHFDEWKKHYNNFEFTFFPVESREKSLAFFNAQVGKDYDPLGILSFILRKDYEDKDKYFCSELIAKGLGIKYKPYRLSPAFLLNLYGILKGWII